MPKISVIVPIYNAADLVPRCIESILSQSFQDFELILIDDGSDKDNSLEVCKKYAKEDVRIKSFYKRNGGQTSARRYGFEQSSGEWIYFVDADDFLPSTALEFLYGKAISFKLDIVDSGSISFFEDFSIKEKVLFNSLGEFDQLSYLRLMFNNQANNGTHACLINRKLFNSETFDIPENVRLGEDAYIHLCLVMQASKIGIYNEIVYNYVQNRKSITHYYQYESIRPIESQIEGIRKILCKYSYFKEFEEVFYYRAVSNLATACFHKKELIYDAYVKKIGKEARPILSTMFSRLLCLFLIYPSLYPFFYLVNELRKTVR